MSAAHFEHKFGSLYFMSGQSIVYMVDELAISFDQKTWTLLKHGRPDHVGPWVAKMRALDPDSRLFTDLAIVQAPAASFDVEDLNRMLDISGYMRTMARKYGFYAPR